MIRTAEAVAIGHPDKVCDQISDSILDACLTIDPKTRSAIEVLGGHGLITISGELTTKANIDIKRVARETYNKCGYADNITIVVNVDEQSPEIKLGVDKCGAGDQGIMVGYATSETEDLMPLEVTLSRKLVRAMGRRDGKAQVTVEEGRVKTVITSVCGDPDRDDNESFYRTARDILSPYTDNDPNEVWNKNPNGKWTIGGFSADTGLTGRKIVVDSYGPNIPVGGGAFSGKDATKVDRSAAYMARKISTDYLRERGAKEVLTYLAYAIGESQPLMTVVSIDGKQESVKGYDLRPQAIIEFLDLESPNFTETARYGHFGNGFVWDK